jgi:dihydrofolate reductase
MRKLKLQVQITVDGFISGLKGEMDWMTFPWTPDINRYVDEITSPVDTILLGRVLAEGFIPHWAKVASDPNHAEYNAGKKYTETQRIVFSNSLREVPWKNAIIASGNLEKEVNRIKNEPGNDIITYGGARFVGSLLSERLVDELHLFVNPVAIGKGLQIFSMLNETQHYKLLQCRLFDCGIGLFVYELTRR